MLGIVGLIFGACCIGSAISCASDDAHAKRTSSFKDYNGNNVCFDRLGRKIVNGERTYQDVKYDQYGNRHNYTVGCSSNHVYGDEFDQQLARERKWDEIDKQQSIEHGKLAYLKYFPEKRKRQTCEISTGKYISCLYHECYADEYRKFYSFDDNLRTSAPGDYGVVITKEEYQKLKIVGGTEANMPAWDVVHKLQDIGMAKQKERESVRR
ncbi:MAG: hypothetical protein ACLTOK_09000 [Anaerobutyricum soehngenii]